MRRADGPGTTRQGLTLLFTDVIGSTATLSLLGDAAWTSRRQAHARSLRSVVAAHGGRVVDEAGDGVFAAFPSASQTLRAAAKIASTSALQDGELPVRVGVHSGEVEVSGGAVSGVAVHVAARVMGLGREGEVVVSRACADQVRGAGFRFESAGEHELKGLDGLWEVFHLDTSSALLPDEPVPATRAPAGGRRRLAAALVLALVAVAAVAGTTLRGDDPDAATTAQPGPALGTGGAAWDEVRPLTLARQQTGAAAVPGALVMAGGLVDGGATETAERYDPAIDAWQPAADLPLPLHHAAMATYGDQAVVIGGWSPVGARLTKVISDRVLVLGPEGWTDLPRLQQPRAAAAAATVGGRLYVTGGQDADGQLLATTEVFDGQSWRTVAPLPTPRDHFGLASDGSYLYAVGGRRLTTSTNLAMLERYDPEQDEWTSLPDMPTARGGVAASVVQGNLVVTGGESPTEALATVESYDLQGGTWSRLPDLPVGVHGKASAVLDGSLYVAGGALSSGHSQATSAVGVLELPPA